MPSRIVNLCPPTEADAANEAQGSGSGESILCPHDPLPTGEELLGAPFRAFPSWFVRIVCERCGKERIIAETHMPRDDAEGVTGNAADPEVLATAKLPAAGRLVVTIPQVFEAGRARANPCFSWPSQKLLVAVVLARGLTEPGRGG